MCIRDSSEAAAERSGANPLLARTGAYFHDVGKLKRPLYFKENQMGENPHDHTDPYVSAVSYTHLSAPRMPRRIARPSSPLTAGACPGMALSLIHILMRTDGAIHLDLRKLRIHGKSLVEILRIGLPAGLQGSLFSISNVLIQSAVNSFGSTVMAGNAAASNLEGFIYTSMNAVYQADMTFASANYGAGQYRRVRRTLWLCQMCIRDRFTTSPRSWPSKASICSTPICPPAFTRDTPFPPR